MNIITNEKKVQNQVKKIIDSIKISGDKALFNYCLKFDKSKITEKNILISKKMINNAKKEINSAVDFVIAKFRALYKDV